MSPVSQTSGLHVERYLGSYLISNNSRGGNAAGHGHKQHPEYDLPGKATAKPPQYLGGPGVFRGGYCPADGIFCPPAFCQNGNNWAGVPLISTANHRRPGKPHGGLPSRPAPHSPSFHHQRMQLINPASRNLEYGDGQHLPLSKLALHTRGAPLILSRRYNNNGNRKQNQFHPNNIRQHPQPVNRLPVVPDIVVKKTRDVPKENRFDYKDHAAVQRAPAQNTLALNIDSLSVTSDESSGSAHSETCLPRIIKPRKRRKKDRKPLNNITHDKTSNDAKSETTEPSPDSTIVTLNPYISSCHERTDINHNVNNNYKPIGVNSNLLDYVKLYGISDNSGKEWMYLPSKTTGPLSTESSKSISKNVNNAEEDESDDSSSLFEAISRCSPTICQCRYCDPSGQIWDIDRHCYSPLLSAPVDYDFEKDKNPFAEKDTILRRSWSEPCPGYSVENLRISDYDKRSTSHRSDPNISSTCEHADHSEKCCESRSVGVIGAGRGVTESSQSPSVLDWKQEPTVPSQLVPETLFKSSSSHGVSLEVSSSIVTSLNGHRDLEIKFFSTSPSAGVTESAAFIYPNYNETYGDKSFDCAVSSENDKCESTDVRAVTVQ